MPSPTATQALIAETTINKGAGFVLPAGLSMTQSVHGLAKGLSLVHAHLTVSEGFTLFTGADNAAKAGGTKIYDFPLGTIIPLGARTDLVLSNSLALGEQTAGEIGLGSVVATGAVAVLSGTSTFEDFMTGGTLGNLAAGGTITAEFGDGARVPIGDGSTAIDLYLNGATTFSDEASAHDMVVDSGTIDIWFLHSAPVA